MKYLGTWKTLCSGRAAAVLGLTGALLAASGGILSAKEGASQTNLVGAWAVQVTLRDCATNAPLGPPFNSLVSFHDGGTISESASSQAFAPGQRTSGHGAWSRQGRHTYDQQMINLIVFDTLPNLPGTPAFNPGLPVSPGFFAGWQTVSHSIKFTDADHFTSSGTNAFFKSDGTQYRTGCSTAAAQRFE